MVGKEIVDAVYNFIKDNDYCNKSEVERGVKICTRLPIRDAIETLMSDKDGTEEPKVKFSKNTPRGFYHLYVNDKNDFNKLVEHIDTTSKSIKVIESLVKFKESIKLISASQLILHIKIGRIAQAINQRIKSSADREILYDRLIQLLLEMSRSVDQRLASNELIHLYQSCSLIKDSKIRREKIIELEKTLKLLGLPVV